ncbi:MAG: hypothetical protein HON70_25390 [Lentisphaerae bacterium]|jgi:hypothetical protein|nr:hypothetical protein [Lentisphaerota bacterium]
MSESRSRDWWRHTASVMALIANVNRDPRRHRTYKPDDFNPHEQKPKTVIRGKGLRILRDVFVKTEPAKEENR